jgi:hypothetical protein
MKPLNLEKALQLYDIIGKFLPQNSEIGTEILDFVGIIVENIIQSGNHTDYIKAVELMTGMEKQTILHSDPVEILKLFTQCLIENRILDLKEFVEGLEDARS